MTSYFKLKLLSVTLAAAGLVACAQQPPTPAPVTTQVASAKPATKTCQTDDDTGSHMRHTTVCVSDDDEGVQNGLNQTNMAYMRALTAANHGGGN